MNQNETLIEKFYSSFAARHYAGMLECYHPNIEFAYAVFTLTRKQVGGMWHMLCESGKDLEVVYSGIQADETSGQAHWEARYTFSATGRRVHNIIEARFQFQDGRIVDHRDRFSFWRWASMALGPTGLVLGWTPVVRHRVRAAARERLEKFIQAHPQYQ